MRKNKKTLLLSALVLGGVWMWVLGWVLITQPTFVFPTTMPSPTATPWPIPQQFNSPDYGVNVHVWWDPWAALHTWRLAKEAGLTWVKQRLAWSDVEGDGPGRYIWAGPDRIVAETEDAGLALILRVDHPPSWAVPSLEGETTSALPVDLDAWGIFCYELGTRYQGRVAGYQIWNEPNLAREWNGLPPDPVAYVEVLRTCYQNLKRADPSALVISAGLAPTGSGLPYALPDTDYLQGMYAAGAKPYFDVLGLNAPGYKAPPEVSPEEAADPANDYGGQPFFCFRHVETMRAIMVEHGDAEKQVSILEFGWHTNSNPDHADYAWFAVTPEQQADYLVRAFRYARENWSPWIGTMFVWNVPDPQWTPDNEEFWWGIVDPFWWGFDENFETWRGGELRPAYEALQEMEKP